MIGIGIGLPALSWHGGGSGGGGVDLVALYASMRGGTLPVYRHPSETYVSEASGTLADVSSWRAQTDPGGQITFTGGRVTMPDHANQQVVRLTLAQTIPAGSRVRIWWHRIAGAGGIQPRLGPTNQNVTPSTISNQGWFSADATVGTDKTYLEFRLPGGNGAAEFSGVCVEPIDLAAPLDIIILAGQSNMVGASSGSAPDPAIDLPHPDIWAMWGSTNNGYAVTAGDVSGARAPLQHRAFNGGLGPGLSFARHYAESRLAPGRKVLVLCTAEGGTALVGDSAPWNRAGDNPFLYDRMIADAQAALALGPDNRVAAVYWAQGESDRSISAGTTYPAAFADLVAGVRSDLGDPAIPFVISGINPAAQDNPELTALMIATQEGLAEGRPNGIAGVHYSGWLAEWGDGTKPIPDNIADTVHFGTDANRVRGIAAAILLP